MYSATTAKCARAALAVCLIALMFPRSVVGLYDPIFMLRKCYDSTDQAKMCECYNQRIDILFDRFYADDWTCGRLNYLWGSITKCNPDPINEDRFSVIRKLHARCGEDAADILRACGSSNKLEACACYKKEILILGELSKTDEIDCEQFMHLWGSISKCGDAVYAEMAPEEWNRHTEYLTQEEYGMVAHLFEKCDVGA